VKKEYSGKSCFQTYPRKIAIKIQRIDQSRKFKKKVFRSLMKVPLPNFSSEDFPVTQNLVAF
jgi:hypothetical protein